MGIPSSPSGHMSQSSLQSFITSHPDSTGSAENQLHNLALQIAHNLKYQHAWTSIRLHAAPSAQPTSTPSSPTLTRTRTGHRSLPRPLLSGVPPQRLYVHPDEQIELLQRQKREGGSGMPELRAEREWVLPSHLRERWTLRRFGEVFDGVGVVPEEGGGEVLFREGDFEGDGKEEERRVEGDGGEGNEWRMSKPKRLLLATLDDDSTVTYYIVHDGVVKPRQN